MEVDGMQLLLHQLQVIPQVPLCQPPGPQTTHIQLQPTPLPHTQTTLILIDTELKNGPNGIDLMVSNMIQLNTQVIE